jgi:hypothetical protein
MVEAALVRSDGTAAVRVGRGYADGSADRTIAERSTRLDLEQQGL